MIMRSERYYRRRPIAPFDPFWTGKSGDSAVRSGDWKLRRCRSHQLELVYLFNVTEDPLELEVP